MAAGIGAQAWLARTLARRGRLRPALAAHMLGQWTFFASLVVGTNVLTEHHDTVAIAIYVGALAYLAFLLWRMWPKIGPYRDRPS